LKTLWRAPSSDNFGRARVNMLTGDIGETAARARRDELAGSLDAPLPPDQVHARHRGRRPRGHRAHDARRVLRRDKFDGIRAQAHTEAGKVALYTRTLDEVTHRFPELVAPLAALKTDAIMDGEIVPARGAQILPLCGVTETSGGARPWATNCSPSTPVVFIAYDLLLCGGGA
jgi:DNA ligase-1